jgi:hypothetical protein
MAGGLKVNEKRLENNLPRLDIHVIGLVKEDEHVLHENAGDEDKVSSSNIRRHLLGTLLRPPYVKNQCPFFLEFRSDYVLSFLNKFHN